jgi:hypothetical protein
MFANQDFYDILKMASAMANGQCPKFVKAKQSMAKGENCSYGPTL